MCSLVWAIDISQSYVKHVNKSDSKKKIYFCPFITNSLCKNSVHAACAALRRWPSPSHPHPAGLRGLSGSPSVEMLAGSSGTLLLSSGRKGSSGGHRHRPQEPHLQGCADSGLSGPLGFLHRDTKHSLEVVCDPSPLRSAVVSLRANVPCAIPHPLAQHVTTLLGMLMAVHSTISLSPLSSHSFPACCPSPLSFPTCLHLISHCLPLQAPSPISLPDWVQR